MLPKPPSKPLVERVEKLAEDTARARQASDEALAAGQRADRFMGWVFLVALVLLLAMAILRLVR